MELIKVFKPLIELEYQMHRLYMWFSDCFGADEQCRKIFRTMAREELQHRDLVSNQRTLFIDNYREYSEIKADIKGILQLTELIRGVTDARQSMSLKESVKFAIQIEKSAVETHYKYLIAKANPLLTELVEKLAQADDAHVQRLIDLDKKIK